MGAGGRSHQVLNASWYASDLDQYGGDYTIQGVSAYNKVVSIQVESWKKLLTVTGSDGIKGPSAISLPADDFVFFKKFVSNEISGRFGKKKLLLSDESCNIEIKWQKSDKESFFPRRYHRVNRSFIERSIKEYRQILAGWKLSTAAAVLLKFPGGDVYFRREIEANYFALADALVRRDKSHFIKHAGKIAGLGKGLTPTGDDLLYGALIAYHHFGYGPAFLNSVRSETQRIAARTNIYGRHMIIIGLEGLTLGPLALFLASIAEGVPEESKLAQLAAIGSGSGIEIAIAIIVFLRKLFV